MKALSLITAARLNDLNGGYIQDVRSYFKLMDLRAGQYWSTADYMRWIDLHQSVFQERLRRRDEHPASFWAAFHRWLNDRYVGDSYIVFAPMSNQYKTSLSALKRWGVPVDDREYNPIWSGPLKEGMDIEEAARYAKYHYEISVGDVIVLKHGHRRTAWFLDNSGFVKIKGFERSRWGDNKAPAEDELDEHILGNANMKEERSNAKCI